MGDLNKELALALATRMLWTAVYVCLPILVNGAPTRAALTRIAAGRRAPARKA